MLIRTAHVFLIFASNKHTLYIILYTKPGTLNGHIKIDDREGHKFVKEYSFNTFRDHSWDIRNWAAIDSLFILLIHFDEPIVIDNTNESESSPLPLEL